MRKILLFMCYLGFFICFALTPFRPSVGKGSIVNPFQVTFSHEAGCYNNEFMLELSHTNPNAQIIYTLDGSEPDINNLNGTTYLYKNSYPRFPWTPIGDYNENEYTSYEYTNPISITSRLNEENDIAHIATSYHNNQSSHPTNPVGKINIIKAKAYLGESLCSETITKSYIVNDNILLNDDLPIVSISLNEREFFDYYEGIYVPGEDFDNWRLDNPDDYPDGSTCANYQRRGREYEKLAYLEYFDANNSLPTVSQYIGLRIHGGWSRSNTEKSIRLYARSEYGNSYMNYPFFENYEYDQFKRLILRNSGNDFHKCLMRDPMIHESVVALNVDIQQNQPVVVFINGEYWGIHYIRERFDKHFLNRKYNTDDNVDIITTWEEVDCGDAVAFNQLMEYLNNHNQISEIEYSYLSSILDIDNVVDYLAVELFTRNHDWPFNNVKMWRYKDSSDFHDGKWRFILYDVEIGAGWENGNDAPYDDSLQRLLNMSDNNQPSLLFRRLFTNDTFKHKFIDRYLWLINTTFKSQRYLDYVASYKADIYDEMHNHINRWAIPSSHTTWTNNIAVINHFYTTRPQNVINHLIDNFDLEDEYTLTLDVDGSDYGSIAVNSNIINSDTDGCETECYPWTGTFIKNRGLIIEAVPSSGGSFLYWNNNPSDTLRIKEIDPSSDTSLTANFTFTTSNPSTDIEAKTILNDAYPNPFNPETNIDFWVTNYRESSMTIYNIKGQIVKDIPVIANGFNTIVWNGKDNNNKAVASGVYFYRLKTPAKCITKKMLLLK